MLPQIAKFIKKHHVLTLATVKENTPHTANLFYACDCDRDWLVFTSDRSTKHACHAAENSDVAVNIVLETKIVGKVCGLQANGSMRIAEGIEAEQARTLYLKRFPYATVMELTLWIVEIKSAKYTDNTLGFGKKLYWERGNGI